MSAFYKDSLLQHHVTPVDEIVGRISTEYGNHHLNQKQQQTRTWGETVSIFKDFFVRASEHISDIGDWGILYEYVIPRRSKRIDVVLLSKQLIFVIEIKNGPSNYPSGDRVQLEDYCLDLRDFHLESKDRIIIPILLCTGAKAAQNQLYRRYDAVQDVLLANKETITEVILKANQFFKRDLSGIIQSPEICINEWDASPYSPTPTIIEAAQTLYSGQSVEEISRNHAGAENLTRTTEAVLTAINQAKESKSKAICFITGVPGAGKTLAGLNIVHNRELYGDDENLGVFLSGNGPLVKVLSEALASNYVSEQKVTIAEARRKVKTFIQNIHSFIDNYYNNEAISPKDRVLIYDEAQRAWNKEHKFKKSFKRINESEPELLMSIMNRINDWAVIVALVGGGQEINTGEAGLKEWGRALKDRFSHWKVYISPELKMGDHSTGNLTLFEGIPPSNLEIIEVPSLHLRVSIRSYRAQEISNWVSLVLEGNSDKAKEIYQHHLTQFPIVITRNLDSAKNWLKRKVRGKRRAGLVASSGGRRLKAYGYDPSQGLRGNSKEGELSAWFLNPEDDVRSSNFLEIIGTEFAVQGLELDWVGLFWGADLRRKKGKWDYKRFKGTKWQNLHNEEDRQFLLNRYRVLLTRAREGMVIWIPEGTKEDRTRLPEFYDETYEFLKACGPESI